jgi:hypothetical protein
VSRSSSRTRTSPRLSEGGKLHMELRMRRGRGYVSAGQKLRRGPGDRLDSRGLGPLAGEEGELPGRGRVSDRRPTNDKLTIDVWTNGFRDVQRRGVPGGEADSRSPEHLHQPRGDRGSDARGAGRSAAHRRGQRAPRQERRGAGAVGAVVQLASRMRTSARFANSCRRPRPTC